MKIEIRKLRQMFLIIPTIGIDTEYRYFFFVWLNRIIGLEKKLVDTDKSEAKKLIRDNNLCGFKASNVNELVDELKCDNLQLKAELRALQKKCDDLERNK